MNEGIRNNAVHLIPGKTFLGTVRGRMNNDVFDFNVYYGNICCSAANGTNVRVSDKTYRKILNNFLNSESGSVFERPSEEEIERAGQIAWNSSNSASLQKNERSQQVSQNESAEDAAERKLLMTREADRRLAEQKAEAARVAAEEARRHDEITLVSREADRMTLKKPVSENGIGNKKKSVLVPVLCILTLLLTALAGYLGAITFGIIGNPFAKTEEPAAESGVHIVQIANDAVAGQEITSDMLRDIVVSSSEYNVLSSQKYMKPDGSIETDRLVLWENVGSIEGKYFSEDLSGGHYLTTSEITDLRLNGSIVEISINGETVRIPMDSITPGSSNAQLYAIITTGNADGSIKNVAVNLGALKLQGHTVTDVIDSAGYSVMSSITGASDIPQADNEDETICDDSEENALSETTEPADVPEEETPEETITPEHTDGISSEENNG